MNMHKRGLAALTTPELLARRARLAGGLSQAGAFLAGSLVGQRRKCGKEGCRCTRGELHGPYTYLQVAGRLVYVPSALAEAVGQHLGASGRVRELLEEISSVNLELLARRELD